MKVQLIVYFSNTFCFHTTFNASVACLSYKLVDRPTASIFGKNSPFGKLTKPSEEITIYLNHEKDIRSFNPGLTRIVEVEIESFKDRLTLIRQGKS